MIAQAALGNTILGAVIIVGGVTVFVALVVAWLYDELGDVFDHHHGKHGKR